MAKPSKKRAFKRVIETAPKIDELTVDEVTQETSEDDLEQILEEQIPEPAPIEVTEEPVPAKGPDPIAEVKKKPTSVVSLSARAVRYVTILLGQYFGKQLGGVDMPAVLDALSYGRQVRVLRKPLSLHISGDAFVADDKSADKAGPDVLLIVNRQLVNAKIR